jgi:hypothetical protein
MSERARQPLGNRMLRECQPWFEPAGTRPARTYSESCTEQDTFREGCSRTSTNAFALAVVVYPRASSLCAELIIRCGPMIQLKSNLDAKSCRRGYPPNHQLSSENPAATIVAVIAAPKYGIQFQSSVMWITLLTVNRGAAHHDCAAAGCLSTRPPLATTHRSNCAS